MSSSSPIALARLINFPSHLSAAIRPINVRSLESRFQLSRRQPPSQPAGEPASQWNAKLGGQTNSRPRNTRTRLTLRAVRALSAASRAGRTSYLSAGFATASAAPLPREKSPQSSIPHHSLEYSRRATSASARIENQSRRRESCASARARARALSLSRGPRLAARMQRVLVKSRGVQAIPRHK